MPYPTLTFLCTYFLGSSSRCIQQGHLLIGTVIINLPPPSTEELLYGIQKWGICWKELHHHPRVYCKPLIDKARVVERHIVPDDDEEWHARPQQPSLLRWDQPVMKCIQECYEALGVVWANSGDMA